MRSALLLIFVFSLCISCTNQDSNYAIISFDPATSARFSNSKPTDLTTVELETIDQLLSKSISEYNSDLSTNSEFNKEYLPNFLIMDVAEYKRQYVPAINEDGEKIVWVNCFCSMPEGWNWHTNILGTDDGGNCYFQLTINLTQGTCEKITINGYA